MEQFSRLLNRLGTSVLSSQFHSSDLSRNCIVELLDRQTRLHTNVIYLGTARQVSSVLKDAILEPDAILICCECRRSFLPDTPVVRNITYLETAMPLSRVFNHLQQALLPRLTTNDTQNRMEQLSQLWRQFMDQKILVREQVVDALRPLVDPIPITNKVRLMLLDHFEDDAGKLNDIAHSLKEIFPFGCVFPYEGAIMILSLEDEGVQPTDPAFFRDPRLLDLLEQLDAHLIVSNRTRDFEMLPTLYRLCRRVLELQLQLQLDPDSRIIPCNRYSSYCILDLAVQRFIQLYGHSDVVYLAHPAMVILTRYDQNHNSNLRDVLYYYLLNNGSISKTASATYMHRNTVLKKLKKIDALLSLDLQDSILRLQLLMSCQLLRYYEHFWGQNVRL